MSGSNVVDLSYGMEKQTTSKQAHDLGTVGETKDGRRFRYSFSGEAIGAGQLTMQKVAEANHDSDLVVASAAAAGASQIVLTLGATAATADQYAEGIVYVNDDAGTPGRGEGHMYKITRAVPGVTGAAHAAVDSAGNITVNLADDDVVSEAITTDAQAGLIENPWKDVEIWDANDVDGPAMGVAPAEVANDEYFWNQVTGYACVLIDGTVVLGEEVMASDNADGAVEAQNYGATVENPTVGEVAGVVAANTEFGIIKLKLD